ncbi:hypothetical protein Tco_0358301 [Tanacetum coccineum]
MNLHDVDNGEPKYAADDQKQVEDGLDNENDTKDKSDDDSSPKEVNAQLDNMLILPVLMLPLVALNLMLLVHQLILLVHVIKIAVNTCLYACFISEIKPTSITKPLSDSSWVEAMREELLHFKL